MSMCFVVVVVQDEETNLKLILRGCGQKCVRCEFGMVGSAVFEYCGRARQKAVWKRYAHNVSAHGIVNVSHYLSLDIWLGWRLSVCIVISDIQYMCCQYQPDICDTCWLVVRLCIVQCVLVGVCKWYSKNVILIGNFPTTSTHAYCSLLEHSPKKDAVQASGSSGMHV